MRDPDHAGTGAGGAQDPDRRGAITRPRATRSSNRTTPSDVASGPREATGRPPTVTTMFSPAPARRTAAATSARSWRIPT